MDDGLTLGVDVGTSSVKVCVSDGRASVYAKSAPTGATVAGHRRQDGDERDVSDIFDAFRRCLGELSSERFTEKVRAIDTFKTRVAGNRFLFFSPPPPTQRAAKRVRNRIHPFGLCHYDSRQKTTRFAYKFTALENIAFLFYNRPEYISITPEVIILVDMLFDLRCVRVSFVYTKTILYTHNFRAKYSLRIS